MTGVSAGTGTGSMPFTQRVEAGAFYTDGIELWEVENVCALGAVDLVNASTGSPRSIGIDAFRRQFWLARASSVSAHREGPR